ncbi:MAG: ribonuclease P protein component [Planctomycetes bacterium]|nr:ribonuclease P protein component [Planctomycetota bacterium]
MDAQPVADRSLPPAARFHHGVDFTRAFDRGQKAGGRHCQVLLRPRGRWQDGTQRCARLGVMVSTKVAPLAVRRHTLKRWVRELFRVQLKQRLDGLDMAVVFRSDPPDHAACDAEILALVERALVARPEGRRRR